MLTLLKSMRYYIISFVWSVVTYDSETSTLSNRNATEKARLNSFETWCWHQTLRICRTGRMTKDGVLKTVEEKHSLLEIINKRRNSWVGLLVRITDCGQREGKQKQKFSTTLKDNVRIAKVGLS